ncbi:MAG: aromatic ring-hydroxylating dioxygenase subunit alpha [Pseudomonadota bacterium]
MTVHPTLSLDAKYYTDPAIYAQEMSGLLMRTWQFAGHANQIPNVGDYFAFNIAGQNLFAIRGRDGVVRTFYNVCQHRAHELVSGTGTTRVVVCPYHQWTYELTGGLRAGPNVKNVPGFDREKICLTEVRTEDFHGFLFVNLDDDAEPMDVWYPGVRDEIAQFVPHIADLAPLEWVEIPEKCNWKVSIENYSECYHCPTCHPTFAQGVVKPETYDIQPDAQGGYVLRHTTECQDLDKMTYPIDLSANAFAGRYQSWFLWPMFSFQCYPGYVLNTYHWRENGVDHCTIYRGWYTQGGVESDVIRGLAVQDRETTVAEDVLLVESVQKGLKSKGYRPGPLVLDPNCGVMSEHSIQKLQHWMRDAVSP